MFKCILLPIDVQQPSSWRRSLPIAERMAADYGADLHVMTVVPDFGSALVGSYFPADFETQAVEKARERLAEIVDAEFGDASKVTTHVAHGSIYEQVLMAAAKLGCDVIVMASHRPELSDYLLGPNASRVVRHANASVFVVRDA